MTDEEKREAYAKLGILDWMEFRDKFEAEAEAERKKNDPLYIQRYSLDASDPGELYEDSDGRVILYKDYIDKIERLKAQHEKELKEAYSRAYDDGKSSNYSWRG